MLTLSLVLTPTVSLDGQDPRRPASPAECADAIGALRSPTLPEPGTDPWWTATRCGAEGGHALAETVGRFTTESDQSRLDRLQRVLTDIEDGTVFDAVLNLAADPSASPHARVFAFLTLLRIHSPSTYVVDGAGFPLTGPARCRTHTVTVPQPMAGAPLPADYRTRAHRAARAAQEDVNLPADVRGAARCVRDHLHVLEVDPQKIRLTYVCGLTFQVRNDNPDWAEVRYEIENTTDWGELQVPPNGELRLPAEEAGTMRLFYEGNLIASEPNRGTTCPP